MEKVTSTRKTLPTTLPSVPVTISATGVEEAVSAAMFPDARLSATRKAKPTIPLNRTENHIAVGTTRWASCVSSARLAAASKPTMVKAPSKNASMKGPAALSPPRVNHPLEETVPVLNKWSGCSKPRITPTITNRRVSPTMPITSVPTAVLLTRADHKVEKMMRTICTNTTMAVTSQAFWGVSA